MHLNYRYIFGGFAAVFVIFYLISVYLDTEPDIFDVKQAVLDDASSKQIAPVIGYTTTTALITVAETLLDKRGGFLANDVLPPSVFMDNMPAWEFGVLEQVRDMALAMRKDFSRSQSQSVEDIHLKKAQPQFNIDHRSWVLPSAESEYRVAINELKKYRASLANSQSNSAQFYTRADNLRSYLKEVEKRLGSLSQRLSASVGQTRLNTDLAGDAQAHSSTHLPKEKMIKTSWWDIDDVFYESRGAAWALLHLLKAIEIDFADVLRNKNALISVQQIIRELEATQQTVWSPMVMNGNGFGMVANHSLVMANYISRANAALIDLTELLSQG
ncbi:DUF2333 family protein [Flocculibacter collagenilyticus]|uniref:DUF2333 family protein n=1 Tax=Flocculibacter collagenilyticus TaxID=2744479 RepID=UPI0018F66C2A|nr:DUF2333 family protein [Flocculibacter collagenilyticus]